MFCAGFLSIILCLLPSYALCDESNRAVGVSSVPEIISSASGVGNKWALLVGINDYEDEEIRDLKYAVNDAKEIYKILIDPECGGFDRENVILLVSDANQREYKPTKVNVTPSKSVCNFSFRSNIRYAATATTPATNKVSKEFAEPISVIKLDC